MRFRLRNFRRLTESVDGVPTITAMAPPVLSSAALTGEGGEGVSLTHEAYLQEHRQPCGVRLFICDTSVVRSRR